MGENKHIEELDAFAKKYIKEVEIETPSVDFTANIMQSILQTENLELYKATPLISKKVWGVLAIVLIGSMVFVSKGTSLSWIKMPAFKMNYLSRIQIPNVFENITISNTMLYACFFFTVMVFIQIYYLKNHLTKKYDI